MDDITKDFVIPAAFILVGWLLGALSPALVERIRRGRDGPLIRAAIRDDLAELRLTLATTTFSIRSTSGDLDRPFLEWARKVFSTYSGIEDLTHSKEHVNKLLAESDSNIAAVAKHWASMRTGGLTLKKFYAHTIDSNVLTIWQLEKRLQTDILDISRRLGHLNEEVEHAQYCFRLTFECSDNNHVIATANLKTSYRNIADMASRIVDRIDAVGTL